MRNPIPKFPRGSRAPGPKRPAGFALVELLVVIAILMLLAGMLAGLFSQFRAVQTLRVGTTSAASVLDRARAESVAGAGGEPHGVHIGTDDLTAFEGSSYSADAAGNDVVPLMYGLEVAEINLAGGGSDVVFSQLTGTTTQAGTIVLEVNGDSSRQRTISISSAGVVSVQ